MSFVIVKLAWRQMGTTESVPQILYVPYKYTQSFALFWFIVASVGIAIRDLFFISFRVTSLEPMHSCYVPRRHFQVHFFNENVWIPTKISLKFLPKGAITNIPALVQVMAWRRSGDKPLSEPMVVRLLGLNELTWVDQINPLQHSQYLGCWCPGDARNTHDIEYVE